MKRRAMQLLNCRGRLVALAHDGTIWLYDVPPTSSNYRKGEEALEQSNKWIALPELPEMPR